MNLNQLTKKEKISVVGITIWTFITTTNYLMDESWRGWSSTATFKSPIRILIDFFEILFLDRTNTWGYDNSILMIYVVLPWLVFFLYLFMKQKS
jgi:hypothetical protein